MKEAVIILGAGVMQGPVINIAKELGFYAIALDGSRAAPCVSYADRFEQIDLKAKEDIETFALSVQNDFGRIGIMTAGTDFSASVAWTAEKLGLPGIPYETALNASDKSRMRECFKKAALPSPDFKIITQEDVHTETRRYGEGLEISYPAVIKPVDNMGSRGCRRIDNAEELEEAVKRALSFSRSGRAIVESYMDGPEFSVDAIVYKGEITICGLADRHIFFPPYFIEMGHTMPTVIEKEKQENILDTFRAGIRALGLSDKDNIGAAKGDIKLTSKGQVFKPMIGEIAARLSGGYMSGWTYPYSSGALPIKGAILAAMGKKPEGLVPIKNWTCAERAFISIPGTVKEIKNKNKEQSSSYINDVFMRVKEGDKAAFPENNVSKCGNIIASAPDRETAVKAAEDAARSILIRLDPADPQTEIFLNLQRSGCRNTLTLPREETRQSETFSAPSPYNKAIFPPDAFNITNGIREALNELPDYDKAEPRVGSCGLCGSWSIIPFPAFESSGLTDYMGRTVQEVLEAVQILCAPALSKPSKNAENMIRLGRSFWAALIRGSYQGAVFYIDSICH